MCAFVRNRDHKIGRGCLSLTCLHAISIEFYADVNTHTIYLENSHCSCVQFSATDVSLEAFATNLDTLRTLCDGLVFDKRGFADLAADDQFTAPFDVAPFKVQNFTKFSCIFVGLNELMPSALALTFISRCKFWATCNCVYYNPMTSKTTMID